jgi:hypothetical protein
MQLQAEPDHIHSIAQVRKWVAQDLVKDDNKIVFIDDDIKFFIRKSPTDWHLRPTTDKELEEGFQLLENKLSPEVPFAGFGIRQGNNFKEPGWESPSKVMFSLGMYLPTFLKICEMGRIEIREDYDYGLQVLRHGYLNAVYHTICMNQVEYNANGGCSDYRTVDFSNSEAFRLAEFHPGFVKTVKREYKNVPRVETICYWNKAYTAGKMWRERNEGYSGS